VKSMEDFQKESIEVLEKVSDLLKDTPAEFVCKKIDKLKKNLEETGKIPFCELIELRDSLMGLLWLNDMRAMKAEYRSKPYKGILKKGDK
jgi:hypothetical protein